MVLYSCQTCNFCSHLKSNYIRHLNTKKHLKKNNQNITNKTINSHDCEKRNKNSTNEHKNSTNEHKNSTNEHKIAQIEKKNNFNSNSNDTFICEFCSKSLKTKPNLIRHKKKYCKVNSESNENILLKKEIIKIKQNHDHERKQLYKQISQLIDKVGNTTHIQNTQNIQLNNYGNEDLSHISDELKESFIKIPYGMIPKMIEAIHFSDKKPENKNIALTNKKENKVKIFTGNKWIYKNKEETINDLMAGKYFILDNFYHSKTVNLNNMQQTNYVNFKEYFDDGDKELIENLKKECELILLNNR